MHRHVHRPGLAAISEPRAGRTGRLALLFAGFLLITSPPARADWKEAIGLRSLQARLGEAMPSGRAIPVSQVEMALEGGDYLPDRRLPRFDGKAVHVRSGEGGVSRHATIVAEHYFGVGNSPACGIPSADVYEANAWVNHLLRVCSGLEPAREPRLIENHSWVGTLGDRAMDEDALRRIDLLVDRDGVVIAAGLNNGSHTPMPRLLCSAYNVVTVGLSNGQASRGPTQIEGSGRVKPDLVAPLDATSWATPVVAACAALLVETSDRMGALAGVPEARRRPARALLVKTLLMGGATKSEWSDWCPGFGSTRSDTAIPLDGRYGAGELNIDHSHRILTAGEWGPGSVPVPPTGWDYESADSGGARLYFFRVAPGTRRGSILAGWSRRITSRPGSTVALTPSLANIDLRLYTTRGARVDKLVAASLSRVDNVEHIALVDPAPGEYAIEVRCERAAEYCLTWDFPSAAQPSPAPAPAARVVAATGLVSDGG